jgi:hypothetical protein
MSIRASVAQNPITISPSSSSTETHRVATSISLNETLAKSSSLPPLSSSVGRKYPNTVVYHQPLPASSFAPQSTNPPLASSKSGFGGLNHRHHDHARFMIFFEVLAGAITLFFLLGLVRCLYSYKKTPARDRIAALLNRHSVHTEMEELGQRARGRDSFQRPPPPPYVPPPPTYDITMGCSPPTPPIPHIPNPAIPHG